MDSICMISFAPSVLKLDDLKILDIIIHNDQVIPIVQKYANQFSQDQYFRLRL